MKAKYKGKDSCGFVHNNEYEITIHRPPKEYTYLIKASYNYSKKEDTTVCIRLTSLKSIERMFGLKEKEIEINT